MNEEILINRKPQNLLLVETPSIYVTCSYQYLAAA